VCALSGVLFPFPEDVPLLYAGMRVASGEASFCPTVLAACAGVFVRDSIGFAIGRTVGAWLLDRPLAVRLIGQRRLERARRLVEERGATAVFVGRFMVGVRFSVFLVAGAMGVRKRDFLRWDALGLLICVPLVILLGYEVGAPMVAIAWYVLARTRLLVAIAGLAVAMVIARRLWTRRVALAGTALEEEDMDD
jgi:membrane protein DedA with SNARE-associated domain